MLHRSIMFFSWGSSEQSLIGSTEFVEQYRAILHDRAVAYIDHHMAIEGKHCFTLF